MPLLANPCISYWTVGSDVKALNIMLSLLNNFYQTVVITVRLILLVVCLCVCLVYCG